MQSAVVSPNLADGQKGPDCGCVGESLSNKPSSFVSHPPRCRLLSAAIPPPIVAVEPAD